MEEPNKFGFYFWSSVHFLFRVRKILIGVIVIVLIVVVLYTIYITPKGFYDKPIIPAPVKPVKK